jgi:hypothetical protein
MSKISEPLVKLAEESSVFVTGLIKENEALHLENARLKRMAGAGGTEAMVILRPGEIDQIVADAVAAEKALADRLGEALDELTGRDDIRRRHSFEEARAALAEWRKARGKGGVTWDRC